MRLTSLPGHLTLLAILSLFTTPALAAFSQPASTFSAGGGVSTSTGTGYENLGVIGQPGIVGSSNIPGGYTANHGFLHVLGDGFKILYPVITATPGTLVFSVMAGTAGDQSLGISNTGGSNLAWTVTKNTPDSIFAFTPGTGTNGGSVTVTADAASLTPGPYSNILTIKGAGISQTVEVLMNLTVTPS
ncbi:MAG: BACON domain-containing protein, partial [Geobacteraceae bacterium]|nr:BACON domain-containing protein [Geobacteraceae bacterium]